MGRECVFTNDLYGVFFNRAGLTLKLDIRHEFTQNLRLACASYGNEANAL